MKDRRSRAASNGLGQHILLWFLPCLSKCTESDSCVLLVTQVVGPIPIPCSYNSSKYNFTADNCAYTDSDGWHTWAQQYAKVRAWYEGLLTA